MSEPTECCPWPNGEPLGRPAGLRLPRGLAACGIFLLLLARPVSAAPADPLAAAYSASEELLRDGRFEEAATGLERALAQAPAAPPASVARVQLLRGIVLTLLDRPADAKAAFQIALCLDPASNPATIDPSPTTAQLFAEAQRNKVCPGAPSLLTLPSATPGPAPPVPPTPTRTAPETPTMSSGGIAGTALLIASGAAIIGGAVVGLLALQAEEEAGDTTLNLDRQQDAAERADRLALGADICFVAGGVAAITGLILLLTRDEPAATPTSARWRPAPGPAGVAGFGLALSF